MLNPIKGIESSSKALSYKLNNFQEPNKGN